jgi:hypothetical protein
VPSREVLDLLTSAKFSSCGLVTTALYELMMVLLPRLPPVDHTELYVRCASEWFALSACSGLLIRIARRLVLAHQAKHSHVLKVLEKDLIDQVHRRNASATLVEVFTFLTHRLRYNHQLFEVMHEYLIDQTGYDAVPVIEAVAGFGAQSGFDRNDVTSVIPTCADFYGTFSAIVIAIKKNRSLKPDALAGKYKGVYRKALDLLGDAKLRVFAPMLAMFPDDAPVPAQILSFFDQIRDKITRTHKPDTEHEW